jgi:hypothetical protein
MRLNGVKDFNGANIIDLTAKTAAVNNLEIGNNSTGQSPYLAAVGSDTDISVSVYAKGAGNVNFLSGAAWVFQVDATGASAVNYPYVQNAATGNPAVVASWGADTDVSLNLVTKGAGVVNANGNPVGVKVAVPSTATSAGVVGQWAADSSNLYICTNANMWRRVPVAAW